MFARLKYVILRWEKQTGLPGKVLRTDNGLEFCKKEVDGFLDEKGIEHHRSAWCTPQQNGRAQRVQRTLMEWARSTMIEAQVPKKVWRLHKAFYGLKQAARAWHLKLKAALVKAGFTVSQADPSLFVSSHGDSRLIWVFSIELQSRDLANPKTSIENTQINRATVTVGRTRRNRHQLCN
jgi:transposase InsO family protein